MNHLYKLSILAVLLVPLSLHAQLLVDCSGSNSDEYPSITAALPDAGPGSTILVTGTCNESVTLQGLTGLSLGAWWGQTASITGGILISESKLIYLYGLNVTNSSPADAIAVVHGSSVLIDTCTGSGSGQVGLASRSMSDVTVAAGAFDNNAGPGIHIDGNSHVLLGAWSGPIDISNNGGPGVEAGLGNFETWGSTSITGNGGSGWGISLTGGSRAQIGTVFGPNLIQGNSSGGATITEGSEISFWDIFGLHNVIQGNGPIGVAVGFGSQATFFDGAQISDHTEVGVDVYANSQANFEGSNTVFRNGTDADPLSAGIRLDGNSEAYFRGGGISKNNGPGILALVNSSVDFTGVTFSGNSEGIITCDSSATMISDLAHPNGNPPHGVRCKTPHALGNRHDTNKTSPKVPDLSAYKARQAKYKKIATKH